MRQLDLPMTTEQWCNHLERRLDELSQLCWRLSERVEQLEGEGPVHLKRCSACRGRKELVAFGLNKSKEDGRADRCRKCERTRHREIYLVKQKKRVA